MKAKSIFLLFLAVLVAQPALARKKRKYKRRRSRARVVKKVEKVTPPVKGGVNLVPVQQTPPPPLPVKVVPAPVPVPREDDRYTAPRPFDATLTALPQGYGGENIVGVYKKLSTEKEFAASYPKDVFCFVRENGDNMNEWSRSTVTYDADRQLMNVDMQALLSSDGRIKIKRTMAYPGEFGEGNTQVAKDYGLIVANRNSFRGEGTSFRILPAEARDLEQNLGVLYVTRLKPSSGVLTETDAQSRYFFREFLVSADVYEIWIFNTKTGTVYNKMPVFW